MVRLQTPQQAAKRQLQTLAAALDAHHKSLGTVHMYSMTAYQEAFLGALTTSGQSSRCTTSLAVKQSSACCRYCGSSVFLPAGPVSKSERACRACLRCVVCSSAKGNCSASTDHQWKDGCGFCSQNEECVECIGDCAGLQLIMIIFQAVQTSVEVRL